MAYDIGAKLQIDGEAQFNASIKAINGNIKALAAEMAATTSAFDENEKSIESLSAKNAVLDKQMAATREKLGTLNSEYDRQKEKLNDLGEALEKAKVEFGENSTEAGKAQNAYNCQVAACSKLEAEINNTTASLNKMSREAENNEREIGELENAADDAGDDVDELSSSADKAGKSMDDAGDKASGFAGKLKSGLAAAAKAAATAVAAATAATAAATKALIDGVNEAASYGDNIDKMSQKLGMSAEAYQEWDAIMEHCGTSIDAMQSGMKTLVTAAQTGNEAFEALGLSQDKIAGMDQEQLFSATITALQKVEDETQRTYLAGQLLGRGATELGPLLNTSAEDIEEMRRSVHELGGVMSNEAVKSAAKYEDTLQDMKTAISGVTRNITAEFMPGLTDLMDGFTRLVTGQDYAEEMIASGMGGITSAIEAAIKRFSELSQTILPVIAGVISSILPDLGRFGTQLISTLLGAVVENVPALSATATQVITEFASLLIENLPMLLTAAGQIITTLVTGIVDALPQLMSAGMSMEEQLVDGIVGGLPDMIARIPQIIDGFLGFITENLPGILDKGVELLNSLVNGILSAIPDFVGQLPEIITSFVNFVSDNLPEIVGAGIDILMNLITGILTAIPDLLAAAPDIIMALVGGIVGALDTVIETGLTIVTKIIEGIGKEIVKVVEKGKEIVGSIKDGIKQKIEDAKNWGKDLINNFIGGITEKWNALKEKVKGVAQTVKDFLGFSEPKEGPLSNFHTYAPDMMKLYAQGIAQNAKLVQGQLDKALAFDMSAANIDFRAGFRAVGRQIGNSVDELTANAVMERRRPEAYGGEGRSGGEGGIDYGLLAEAIVKGLDGAGVYLAGRKVGQLVTRQQENNARARGINPVPV